MGQCTAQFAENFDDGDITNSPTWSGDVNDYAVVSGQCRLNAREAGVSFIHTPALFPDSIRYSLDFEINTSPSGSNFSRIYLALTDTLLSEATGLYLQLGESGSNDAIRLVYLNAGTTTELANATMGAIASPSSVHLIIEIDDQNNCTLAADYSGTGIPMAEFSTTLPWSMSEGNYVGLLNSYTASNVTNYAYDNIIIEELIPDSTPPQIAAISVRDSSSLILSFDELLSADVSDFTLVSNVSTLMVESATLQADQTSILVVFSQPMDPSILYEGTISGVQDLQGNALQPTTIEWIYAVAAKAGDLLLNEILFDPRGNGSDYVEIVNVSDRYLDLESLVISNESSGNNEVIESTLILAPKQYLLLTEDVAGTQADYFTSNPNRMVEQDLPSFNNSDGNVTLIQDDNTIDAFDYDEDMHFVLLDDTDGVSLERISLGAPTQQRSNWQSAAQTIGFGTPGLPNSVRVGAVGGAGIKLQKQTFSPNQDGSDDVLVVEMVYNKPGYVVNATIYSELGFPIKRLANNQLVPTEGALFWDGIGDDGRRALIGAYAIKVEAFHPDGDVIQYKDAFVLADFLD